MISIRPAYERRAVCLKRQYGGYMSSPLLAQSMRVLGEMNMTSGRSRLFKTAFRRSRCIDENPDR